MVFYKNSFSHDVLFKAGCTSPDLRVSVFTSILYELVS